MSEINGLEYISQEYAGWFNKNVYPDKKAISLQAIEIFIIVQAHFVRDILPGTFCPGTLFCPSGLPSRVYVISVSN